jgi:hypothetical protein
MNKMGSIVWIFSFEPYHSDWMLELYELLGVLLPQADDVVKSGLFFFFFVANRPRTSLLAA